MRGAGIGITPEHRELADTVRRSCVDAVGVPVSRQAALLVYEESVAAARTWTSSLHDRFSVNELLTYEALGTCATEPRPTRVTRMAVAR